MALDMLLARLARLGDRVRTDDAALAAASRDESHLSASLPGAVIFPASTAEVALVAREAHELGVGLVPRGGGTGKSGACLARRDQVVVDFSRMNRILELRTADLYAVVEPGVITAELDRAARERGFMYPPDPASWESCTIGGNIATNAGGPRAVKYGVTHAYVWGLEVVLPGGRVIEVGRRSIKGVGGYDLTSLFVGSEGTLGFITRATVHLVPAAFEVQTAWLSFAAPLLASRAAERVFAAGIRPRMLELVDRVSMDLVRPVSSFRLPEAGAALLVETDGDAALPELLRLAEAAQADDSAVAESETDREAMRRARRLVSPRMKEAFPHKLSDDIAVPRSRMADTLAWAAERAAAAGLRFAAYGHLGDGNLHVNLLCSADELERGAAVRAAVLAHTIEEGGMVSGEHGIGLVKRRELAQQLGPEVVALERAVKSVFDPRGVMNPGKVLD
jgi:glycolate oxidase